MRALCLAVVVASAGVLTACGGGGGDHGGTDLNGSELPGSALRSSDGFIDYVKQLIATRTDETSEPVALGNVTLPVSDTTEPVPVN